MRYLYYKIYQILRKIKTNDTPATNAMLIFSMFELFNIATLQVLLNHILHIKIGLKSKDNIMFFGVLLALLILIINYFVLYKKREIICEKYKDETKIKSMLGYVLLILYMIGSAALVYYFSSRHPL